MSRTGDSSPWRSFASERKKTKKKKKDILLSHRWEKAVKYGISNHTGIQRRQTVKVAIHS